MFKKTCLLFNTIGILKLEGRLSGESEESIQLLWVIQQKGDCVVESYLPISWKSVKFETLQAPLHHCRFWGSFGRVATVLKKVIYL